MLNLLRRFVQTQALEHDRFTGLWRRLDRISGETNARYLRKFGKLHAMGDNCSISTMCEISDPAYVRLGNNVRLARCLLLGHDGSVNMIRNAYGARVDRVGKIDLRDNVFVGVNAIIMPGVTIGPDAIVAAGSVVTKDVEPGTIVGGVPAKPIGKVTDFVQRLTEQTAALPWGDLIAARSGSFDPAIEPELVRRRVEHFFGESGAERPAE